jgi:hypothetical protein
MPVARAKGAKPLPPFERWAFAEAHYLQYLCDMLSVHSALEQALASCTAAASPPAGQPALVPGPLMVTKGVWLPLVPVRKVQDLPCFRV